MLDSKSHDASPYFVITVTNGRERKRTRSFFERGQRSWEIVSKAVRLAQRAKSPLRSNISPFLCKYLYVGRLPMLINGYTFGYAWFKPGKNL